MAGGLYRKSLPEIRRGQALPTHGVRGSLFARRARNVRFSDEWLGDVRHAARALARDRGFTAAAILTLALGFGANTAIFAVLYNAVLRPLPYERAGSLMHVRRFITSDERGPRPVTFSYADYLGMARDTRAFESIAAYAREPLTLGGMGYAERITAEIVSPTYFSTLGVAVPVGTPFDPGADRRAAQPAAILSHALWAARFSRRADIVGTPIRLNGAMLTVAGVAADGFRGDSGRADLWIAAATARDVLRLDPSFEIIARRRSGVAPAQADGDVRAFVAGRPRPGNARIEGTAVPLATTRRDPKLGTVLAILYAAVLFIVLIACANVANLLLARGVRRRREMAIRLSLGASRWTIVRRLLMESLLVSAAGCAFGLVIGIWILHALAAFQPAAHAYVWPTFSRGLDTEVFAIAPHVYVFSIGFALATTLLFGLLPAGLVSRDALRDVLSTDASAWSLRRANGPWRGVVAAQVALVLVLLAGAGLMVRSFVRLLDRPLGIDGRGIMTCRVNLPYERYKPPAAGAFFERLRDRIAAIPGVETVARVRHLPLIERGTVTPLRVAGSDASLHAGFNAVDPEFFKMFGVSLREGRVFDAHDGPAAPPVIIVTESTARNLFGTASAIGRRLSAMGTAEVVGVIRDIHYEPQRPQLPIVGDVYVSMRQRDTLSAYVAVRSSGDPRNLLPSIRAVVAELDPELPVYDVTTMPDRLRSVQSYARFTTLVLTAFAGLALVLAVIGIYGTVGYAVASRRREIGIRMALGAQRASVIRLFLREGLLMCAGGAVAGVILAFMLTRVMRSVLYETAPTDPIALGAAVLLVIVAAAVACSVPARRAASVDPSITLRQL